ncbi:TIGR04282 family arsenosugar biosynthesis glycosyltransferase [Leptospira biflexa]|uniref:TIGR04282 family arsenosugar biosynthesis glycosyltransferase n=1 Tax=Leptospira biflexa TaxID=172 RepID=UPI002D776C5B|nr:TIGR04282 family arsenosugar biosynthesis glycosyltransferase [Leptospira biflexa]
MANSIGDERALDVYQELLTFTNAITETLDVQKIVYWDEIPSIPNQFFKNGFLHSLQSRGDLGEKMEKAFQNELDPKPCQTLIIGTDCPYLTVASFEKAYKELEKSDFVIGPAKDGGYYLLGMKEFFPNVFLEIPWSTESVLPLTIKRIQDQNLTFTLLEELNDIDTVEDWKEWKQNH